jgi:acyl-CoA dehydrogenase
MRFVLHELLGDDRLAAFYNTVDYSGELADSILDEAAKFGENVLEPLNKSGDAEGAKWTADGVVVPKGFREAYASYTEGGWTQLSVPEADGGQGMPQTLNTAAEEIFFASNMAFYLGTSLARGAVEAIAASAAGGPISRQFLPKLVSGEWMGTMNLTEAQAGSDLGLMRTRAVAEGDHYRVFGQKIFITYGDHDMTDNIVHLVLGRIDGAPAGTRGISLFLVPKVLVNADGSAGAPNDVRCISIEHKLGLHASPTCVMAFGETQGAVGYLLGAPNSGLAHMFIMMNAARLSVGVQGLAQSERAFQQALDWARNRLQGRPVDGTAAGPVAIVNHPDVRRMLLSMKSRVEAMRALAYAAALSLDAAHREADEAARATALLRAELLTPIVKGWCTEIAIEVTSTGIQVHGGMGFIEETGASQFLRDVRVASIYEGTTGIQSNDLIGRKLGRDKGAAMTALLDELGVGLQLQGVDHADFIAAKAAALETLALLRAATASILVQQAASPAAAMAVSVPYLMLCGTVISGALLAQGAGVAATALAGGSGEAGFYEAKLRTARFYADQVLPGAHGLARIVGSGAASVTQADPATL